jgi:hypothetical protein
MAYNGGICRQPDFCSRRPTIKQEMQKAACTLFDGVQAAFQKERL